MNELQKVGGKGLAIAHPGVYKAIDVRRDMVNIPQVMQALTASEKQIFLASVKQPIGEINNEELVSKVGTLAKYITRDAGIRKIDEYDVTRFLNILVTYYSTLSLSEVRIAFELAMIGELDEYLPRDRDGRPDKNHYQSFSVDYITKVLSAYNKKSKDTQYKAYCAIPERDNVITPQQAEFYQNECKKMVINYYLEYKYRGKMPDNINAYLAYETISRAGLADPIIITQSDKNRALSMSLNKAHNGLIGAFIGECIRRQGDSHEYVMLQAKHVSMIRALTSSFERMAREEIQIDHYITIK